uniref:C2H2-type domain-containing protein n=1 Tax=Neogobius melanostomus TaxID=47308 RepID=A0A8C6V0C7_9GOBI
MTEQQDRPYVCSAPGCSQRFQLEEHLSVHRHKHEMTLKFCSIKGDGAFTGGTPTPTKFLQNCDEVGLFKEIEEEFLQAQEEEKKQMLPQNGPSCMNQLKGQAPVHLPPAHTHSHACPPPQQDSNHQHHHHHNHNGPLSRSQPLQHPPWRWGARAAAWPLSRPTGRSSRRATRTLARCRALCPAWCT